MQYIHCWHRPGRVTRSGVVTCRYCGVAIDWCSCVNTFTFRNAIPDCDICEGSWWVAVIRGQRDKFAEFVGDPWPYFWPYYLPENITKPTAAAAANQPQVGIEDRSNPMEREALIDILQKLLDEMVGLGILRSHRVKNT